ncbi:MAG: transglutaminase [Hyphomicrobiales bacterium]|nr:MAG: transglutaminase [Hyphomicrobiales bacterium]
MRTTGITAPPIGHVRFCESNRGECRSHTAQAKVMTLTRARWQELLSINDDINRRIEPVTDRDLYNVDELWTYPKRKGDCEDYVLLKRRELIQRGWPVGALLITVVRDQNGDGHAVLTARTDRGEFILDNQVSAVLPWNETDYRFIKRQSETDEVAWKNISDTRVWSVGSLAKR